MFARTSLVVSSLFLSLACNGSSGSDTAASSDTCADSGFTDGCDTDPSTTEASETVGDTGDGDGTGDGDTGDGDTGDGDSGDGDTGDGDTGDGDTGDGDSGDGDGDGDSGDGDGDSGDGDGDEPCESDEDCPDGDICNEATMECQPDCGTAEVTLAAPPPPVMLVLDKSGSMVNNTWDHDGNGGTPEETRWATLYSVTDFLLTNFEGGIAFGLQLFPSTSANTTCANDASCPACDVSNTPEVGLANNNKGPILAAMPAANANSSSVAGATPAAGGIVNAKAALDVAISEGQEGAAMIFITDGAANCGLQYASELCEFPGPTMTSADCKLMDYFDDELEGLIGGYFNTDGIPTYVVGIDIQDVVNDPESAYNFSVDNTNVYDELNSIALAGGVPQMGGSESFYNATNEAELLDAFNAIAGELATCDIDLSEAPNTPPLPSQIPFVEFQMMDMMVPGPLNITPAECDMGVQDGWIWVVEGISVRFCGTYCDQLISNGEVDGIYGCPMGT